MRIWGAGLLAALLTTSLLPTSSATPENRTMDAGAVESRIINGVDGVADEFPFLVSVLEAPRYRQDGAYRAQFCAGSLTTPLTVVTAAHCVVNQKTGARTPPERLALGFGPNLKSPSLRIIAAESVTVHPNYRISTAQNDIAVIKLAVPVNDIPTIQVLMQNEDADYTKAGTPARVAGWGNTSATGDRYPENFKVGDVVIFPPQSCGGGERYTINGVRFFGFTKKDADTTTMICAAGATKDGRILDACQGDSGGPLVVGTGAERRLVGAVSWGETCASKYPGVYTRLSAERGFLEDSGAVAIPPPMAPPTVVATGLNASLRVRITANAADKDITAYAATATDPADGTTRTCFAAPTRKSPTGSCVITGLTNGATYAVTAISANPFGNSPPSAPMNVIPTDQPFAGAIVRIDVDGDDARFTVRRADQNGATLSWYRVICTDAAGALRFAAVSGTTATIRNLAAGDYACVTRIKTAAGIASSAPMGLTVP